MLEGMWRGMEYDGRCDGRKRSASGMEPGERDEFCTTYPPLQQALITTLLVFLLAPVLVLGLAIVLRERIRSS